MKSRLLTLLVMFLNDLNYQQRSALMS